MSNKEMEKEILKIMEKFSIVEGNQLWLVLHQPEQGQYRRVLTSLLTEKKIVRMIKRDEDGEVECIEFALPKANKKGETLCLSGEGKKDLR